MAAVYRGCTRYRATQRISSIVDQFVVERSDAHRQHAPGPGVAGDELQPEDPRPQRDEGGCSIAIRTRGDLAAPPGKVERRRPVDRHVAEKGVVVDLRQLGGRGG